MFLVIAVFLLVGICLGSKRTLDSGTEIDAGRIDVDFCRLYRMGPGVKVRVHSSTLLVPHPRDLKEHHNRKLETIGKQYRLGHKLARLSRLIFKCVRKGTLNLATFKLMELYSLKVFTEHIPVAKLSSGGAIIKLPDGVYRAISFILPEFILPDGSNLSVNMSRLISVKENVVYFSPLKLFRLLKRREGSSLVSAHSTLTQPAFMSNVVDILPRETWALIFKQVLKKSPSTFSNIRQVCRHFRDLDPLSLVCSSAMTGVGDFRALMRYIFIFNHEPEKLLLRLNDPNSVFCKIPKAILLKLLNDFVITFPKENGCLELIRLPHLIHTPALFMEYLHGDLVSENFHMITLNQMSHFLKESNDIGRIVMLHLHSFDFFFQKLSGAFPDPDDEMITAFGEVMHNLYSCLDHRITNILTFNDNERNELLRVWKAMSCESLFAF